MRFRILIVGTVLLLAFPSASAHIAHPPETNLFRLGPYEVVVTPTPAPIVQNTSTVFVLVDVKSSEQSLPPANITIDLGDAFHEERDFTAANGVYETSPLTFTAIGSYHALVSMANGTTTHSAEFDFDVYRALPFVFVPIDALEDPVEGRAFSLTFRTADRSSEESIDALDDLRLVAQPKPTEEGTSPPNHGAVDPIHARFDRNETGTWTATLTFPTEGTWVLRLASDSGGFNESESTPWQVDVIPGQESRADAPAAILGILAVGVAVAGMRVPSRRTR